jgi:hypothetical protein
MALKSHFANDKFRNELNICIDGFTPLANLFSNENNINENTINIVRKYLEEGADPNMPCILKKVNGSHDLYSPLYLACQNKYDNCIIKIIELLLENGADPNPIYIPIWNYTPLVTMLENNNTATALPIAKLLIKYGANTNIYWDGKSLYSFFEENYDGPDKDKIRELLYNPELANEDEKDVKNIECKNKSKSKIKSNSKSDDIIYI